MNNSFVGPRYVSFKIGKSLCGTCGVETESVFKPVRNEFDIFINDLPNIYCSGCKAPYHFTADCILAVPKHTTKSVYRSGDPN